MRGRFFNISLVLTVLTIMLCVVVFYTIPKFKFCKECSVAMAIYTEKLGKHYKFTLNDLLKDKKIHTYELTGNDNTDKDIFKEYRNAVHSLAKSNDTIKAIHFKFNAFTKYQEFVDAFDICFIENVMYVYEKNDLWIMNKSIKNSKNKHLFYSSYYNYSK